MIAETNRLLRWQAVLPGRLANLKCADAMRVARAALQQSAINGT
ncbi:MAG: hypothetical protein ACJ0TD_08020 [Arenicellales bacterium]